MDGIPTNPHPLNDNDCRTLLDIVNNICPRIQAQIAELEEMGLPLPNASEQNAANHKLALGILRVKFPDRLA